MRARQEHQGRSLATLKGVSRMVPASYSGQGPLLGLLQVQLQSSCLGGGTGSCACPARGSLEARHSNSLGTFRPCVSLKTGNKLLWRETKCRGSFHPFMNIPRALRHIFAASGQTRAVAVAPEPSQGAAEHQGWGWEPEAWSKDGMFHPGRVCHRPVLSRGARPTAGSFHGISPSC